MPSRPWFQFSLRALLALMAIAALAVWGGIWWSQRNWARLSFLNAASPEAAFVTTQHRIEQDGNGYKVVFHTRYQDVYKVFFAVGNRWSDSPAEEPSLVNDLYQHLHATSADMAKIQAAVVKWQAVDVPIPGRFVINGIVRDSSGLPVEDADVDLIGQNPFAGECRTRSDGSFSMQPKQHPKGICFLKIHRQGGEEVRTREFTVNETDKEYIVSIRLP